MTDKDVSKEVLDRIKKESIAPKPKWKFFLKKSVWWGMFGLTTLFGGFAFSLVIFMLNTNDWEIYERAESSSVAFFFEVVPLFSLVLFVVFLLISLYNFKHTSRGYRFNYIYMILINIFATVILGFAFFGMGLADYIDDIATDYLPYYEQMAKLPRHQMWMNPEQGMIAGKIREISDENIIIVTIDRKEWIIILKDVPGSMKTNLNVNYLVGIIGERLNDNTIRADVIKILPDRLNSLPDRITAPPEIRKNDFLKEKMMPQRIN